MIADGLVDEVRELKRRGYGRELNALNTFGYKEVFRYLDGELDLDETAGGRSSWAHGVTPNVNLPGSGKKGG